MVRDLRRRLRVDGWLIQPYGSGIRGFEIRRLQQQRFRSDRLNDLDGLKAFLVSSGRSQLTGGATAARGQVPILVGFDGEEGESGLGFLPLLSKIRVRRLSRGNSLTNAGRELGCCICREDFV
ncbi:hypothetical protein OROGR_020991 [Orobanche gracilis]